MAFRGLVAMVCAVFLVPLVVRGVLPSGGGGPGPADLRGLFSDLVVSLGVAALLVATARRARWLALGLALVWVVLGYGNYEHVATLGANASLAQVAFLADPVFLRGSVLDPTRPWLLGALLAGCLALVGLGLARGASEARLGPLLVVAALGAGVHLLWPLRPELLAWRQQNLVYENLAWLATRSSAEGDEDSSATLSPELERAVASLFRADLAGEPIVPLGRPGTNVLLVLLEGISGAHLPSVAASQEVAIAVELPALDRLARDNVVYRSFVAQQRQTNRGEYAILCGDPPKLVVDEPKMTERLDAPDLVCLPRVLRDAGYETVYLQSAPLGFMSKDLFMPKSGFSQVLGSESFALSRVRNHWGVDDAALLEQGLEQVRALETGSSPWFLTLLTVGTHHPYLVPPGAGERSFANAAAYLDEAVERFAAGLEALGVRDDTLVLVTSDESVGISGYRGARESGAGEGIDDLTRRLSDNWGFLIAMLPGRERAEVDAEFVQADLALSVLDYLGLAGRGEPFIGRSVFRRYERPRPVVFGNVYQRWLGALAPPGGLTLCPEDFAACHSYELGGGRLFSPHRTAREPDARAVALLRAAVGRDRRAKDRPRVVPLLAESWIPVASEPGLQMLFGGQYLSVPAGSRIEVELVVEVEGRRGRVFLKHTLKSGRSDFHFRETLPILRAGDRLTLRYAFTAPEDLEYLEGQGTAQRLPGPGELALRFDSARLTVSPPRPGQPDRKPGLEIEALRVDRAGGRPAR